MSQEESTSFSVVSLGKPIEKLIDAVSKFCGTLYKPRAIRNEADAKAYEIVTVANARAKASIIAADAKSEIEQRAGERIYNQEMQRQVSIDTVIDKSIKFLSETVSEQPLDPDWTTRFFNRVQDIQNDEVLEIWAKILANEINIPGSFSIRTIDALSNLSHVEAGDFKKLLTLKFESKDDVSVLMIKGDDLKNIGMSTNELLNLDNAGLIFSDRDLVIGLEDVMCLENGQNVAGVRLQFGEKKCFGYKSGGIEIVGLHGFPAIPFTKIGCELASAISVEPNYEYLEQIISYWSSTGFDFIML